MECKIAPLVFISTDKTVIVLQIAVAILNIVIGLFGTLANSLVIMAYYRNHRLRTIHNTIFFLLAITDINVTAFIEPIYATVIMSDLLGKRNCLLWDIGTILSELFLGLSLTTIVILSLQTYITLVYPYHWQIMITKSRFNLTIVFTWLLVLLLTLGVYLHVSLLTYGFPCIISLTLITVVFTWGWTYKLLAKHRRAIEATQTPSNSQNISRKRILRSTATALVIILCLLGCYFLALCCFFWKMFMDPWKKLGRDTYEILWSVAVTFMYLNSLLNPCLVFLRSTPFRETAKNILNKQRCAWAAQFGGRTTGAICPCS